MPYLHKVVSSKEAKRYQKAWSLAYLGTGYFYTGNSNKATQYLIQCLELNATKNVNNFAAKRLTLFGLDKRYQNFITKETDHFVFHLHPEVVKEIKDIGAFVQQRERAFYSINNFFKNKLPKKIDFFVWNSSATAEKIVGRPLGFSIPEFCISHTPVDQTIGHEMAHVISHFPQESIKRTPLINEGTAVYFDQTKRNRLETAQIALQKSGLKNIAIKDIWNNRNIGDAILYPVGGALIEHLIQKGGEAKFLQFIKNQTYENAQAIYGQEIDNLITSFEQKLGTHAATLANKIAFLDLTDTNVLAVIEKDDPADKNYRVLFLVNEHPIAKKEFEKIDPKVIQDIKFVKEKAAIKKYTSVDVNGIILINASL